MNNIFRRTQRMFSSSAPKLAVRPHLPWYWRWLLALPVFLLTAWLVYYAYTNGVSMSWLVREQTEDELSRLKREDATMREENARLNTRLVELERQMQIEHSANSEMEKQLKALNEEKMHLNEDLAFFQNLTQSGARQEKLSIQRLRVSQDTLPGEYHCSMLLVQSGTRQRDFRGHLQFVVNGTVNGKKSVLVFPAEDATKAEIAAFEVDFKYYQRVERTIKLPEGMKLEGFQVRMYERKSKEPKIKQDAILS